MRILVQRVKEASVTIDTKIIGEVQAGLLLFVGIHHHDTPEIVQWCVQKCLNLRIFSDSDGKMNLSLLESHGEALVISQFTLYADCAKGRRPSFAKAAQADKGEEFYELFVTEMIQSGIPVATGKFQAHMDVALINDGPVTLMIEKNFQE